MNLHPPSLERLISALARFPGVGRKTAQRFAFHLLKGAPEDAQALSEAVKEAAERIVRCRVCGNFSEAPICAICQDHRRDRSVICVVEDAMDFGPFERSGYRGLYHALGGLFSPLSGVVDADQLRIQPLLDRLDNGEIKEVILATPPTPDGEATALWLAKALRDRTVTLTRLGMGLPMGGALEYADEITLQKALESRKHL
jgi:recombination protein RecR